MNSLAVVLIGTFFTLLGCQPESDATRTDDSSYTTPPPSSSDTDPTYEFRKYLEEHYVPLGTWVERNGFRFCDGYLTRYEGTDYCIAELPDGWLPLELDGDIYYAVPLEENDE